WLGPRRGSRRRRGRARSSPVPPGSPSPAEYRPRSRDADRLSPGSRLRRVLTEALPEDAGVAVSQLPPADPAAPRRLHLEQLEQTRSGRHGEAAIRRDDGARGLSVAVVARCGGSGHAGPNLARDPDRERSDGRAREAPRPRPVRPDPALDPR